MSSSTQIGNTKKYVLILGKGPTQGSEHTLSAQKIYSINFTEKNKDFCLSLDYSYLFVNGIGIIKFKSKDPEIGPYQLCLRNIYQDWSADDMKKRD